MATKTTCLYVNRTDYADGSRLRVEERMDRWQVAQWLREIRRNLDVVLLRDGPHRYYVAPVRSAAFERTIEVAP